MRYFLPIAVLLSSCAINRAPSLNLLKQEADYEGIHQVEDSLKAVDNPLLVPIRTEPIVADLWIHPHELPSGDYFRGGWIRTVVTRSEWKVDRKIKPLWIKPKPKPTGKHSEGRRP